jgi:hypothetical protein
VYLNAKSAVFEMFEGARIADNKMYLAASTTGISSSNVAAIASGAVGAVTVNAASASTGGTFTMHGGEISGTNFRGVAIVSSSSYPAAFYMEGGTITGNGKAEIIATNANGPFYALGGGLYLKSVKTGSITGGAITHNGKQSEALASGLCVSSSEVVLNGTIDFTGNAYFVALTAKEVNTGLPLGSSFQNGGSGPILLEGGPNGAAAAVDKVANYSDGATILPSAEENGANIAEVKNSFVMTRIGNINNSGKPSFWGTETFDMSIGDDGKLAFTLK